MEYVDIDPSKLTDTQLRQMTNVQLITLIRQLQKELQRNNAEYTNKLKEINSSIHAHLYEIQGLKDVNERLKNVNQRLQGDNQEMRDLACFLDDDRQRGRKLAKEWQRFGRYTSGVMRSEVSTYQEKLRELELKQKDLIKQNFELKELCLFLDEELINANGDGGKERALTPRFQPTIAKTDSQTAAYVKKLENRISVLEQEKSKFQDFLDLHAQISSAKNKGFDTGEDLGDFEKAIVRQLCGIVSRKLDEKVVSDPSIANSKISQRI